MKKLNVFLLVASLCVSPQMAFSADQPPKKGQLEMHWSELATFLAQGTTKLVLPDGTLVEGQTLAVTQDDLVLLVSKTSDRRAHPKGRLAVPRKQVTTIVRVRNKRAIGRIGLTIAGFIVGAAPAAAVTPDDGSGVGGAAGAGVAAAVIGLPIAGYYLGRKLIDRETKTIRVIQDE